MKTNIFRKNSAFTLIELLVVIAIIAILSIVVVLTLSPGEMLRQARDGNRVSDLDTLTHALSLYQTDMATQGLSLNLGSSSLIYISLPDPQASTTAGSNCASLNLPILPTGYTYHCAGPNFYRLVNGTGWLPLALSAVTTGNPLSSLPVDPQNQSSSRLYYAYATNGSNYEFTAAMESNKYKLGGTNDVVGNDGGTLATVYEKGSKLGLEPLDYGDPSLVGYWPFDEGTGTTAWDWSGNNETGTLGSGSVWTAGKNGAAIQFVYNTNSYVSIGSSTAFDPPQFTISAWISPGVVSSSYNYIFSNARDCCGVYNGIEFRIAANSLRGTIWNGSSYGVSGASVNNNSGWQFAVFTYDGNIARTYQNGVMTGSGAFSLGIGSPASYGSYIGTMGSAPSIYNFNGIIDNVRMYNRPLSASEIQALYNAEK